MTDLEERVRAALHARAWEFTPSPDAWERTQAKAGRRAIRRQARDPDRHRWLTRFTPLAAAAAVVVIGVGTATLAETGGFSTGPRKAGLGQAGSQSPSAGATVLGPPCSFPRIAKNIPVAGVQISAKVTVKGVTTWWTRIPESMYPQAKTTLAVCQLDADGGSGGPESPLGNGQLVQASAPTHGLGGGASVSGIAAASVTSVEAVLANGNIVKGGLAFGSGFPYAVWWLTYPQDIGATLIFRDAAGQAVKKIAEPYPPAGAVKQPVALTPDDVSGVTGTAAACQQARVQQVMDGVKIWTYVGLTVPQAVQPHHAKPTLCEVTGIVGAEPTYSGTYTLPAGQVARTLFALNPTSTVSGIAAPRVASMTAVVAGKQFTGTIITGKLLPLPVWIVSYPLSDPATLVFRDAAGAQIAELKVQANPQP